MTVTFTVTGLERIEGHGRLLALVALEIEFDGVTLGLQGVQVVRRGKRMATLAPRFRDPKSGVWMPAVILPTSWGRRSRRRCTERCRAGTAGQITTRLSRKCSARRSSS